MTKEQFKTWRQKMNFTQQQAADALGLYRLTVANYERGTRLGKGTEIIIPRSIALACAAIEAGLKPVGEDDAK